MEKDVGHEELYNNSVVDCANLDFAHNQDNWDEFT